MTLLERINALARGMSKSLCAIDEKLKEGNRYSVTSNSNDDEEPVVFNRVQTAIMYAVEMGRAYPGTVYRVTAIVKGVKSLVGHVSAQGQWLKAHGSTRLVKRVDRPLSRKLGQVSMTTRKPMKKFRVKKVRRKARKAS